MFDGQSSRDPAVNPPILLKTTAQRSHDDGVAVQNRVGENSLFIGVLRDAAWSAVKKYHLPDGTQEDYKAGMTFTTHHLQDGSPLQECETLFVPGSALKKMEPTVRQALFKHRDGEDLPALKAKIFRPDAETIDRMPEKLLARE
jgi:hypothetical protein